MEGEDQLAGVVREGRFHPLVPPGHEIVRLTSIPPQAAQSPESGELPLAGLEGFAVLVRGRASGDWIFSASVVDTAGPLLAFVLTHLFGAEQEEEVEEETGEAAAKKQAPKGRTRQARRKKS